MGKVVSHMTMSLDVFMSRALLSLTVSTLEDQRHQRMPADISITRRACKHGGVTRSAPGRG